MEFLNDQKEIMNTEKQKHMLEVQTFFWPGIFEFSVSHQFLVIDFDTNQEQVIE